MSLNGLAPLRKGAEALRNGRLIYLQSLSGYRGPRESDHRGLDFTLPFDVDVDDVALRNAMVAVVAKSRFILPRKRVDVVQHPDVEFDEEMFSLGIREARYRDWPQMVVQDSGYRTEKEIFERMMRCQIEAENGVMTISPSKHDSLFGWGREENDGLEDVIIPDSSSFGI
jgi:hypothetical protein